MNRLRIVQAVGWYLPDSIGGTELYVAALAAQLREAGHEVRIAAPDTQHGEREYEHAGCTVYRYPIPAQPTREEARGLVVVRGSERLHQWLSRTRPDVVHVHTFVTGLGLAEIEAARQTGARVIVTTHSAALGFLCERGTLLRDGTHLCDARVTADTCAACALTQRGLPATVARVVTGLGQRLPASVPRPGRVGTALDLARLVSERREAQQRMLEIVDGFVVLSEWARGVVIANGAPAAKVHVNRLGIAPRAGGWPRKPAAAVRPTTTPLVIGYLGRAEAIKGIDDLVHAALSVPSGVPLRLRVVASASNEAERVALRDLARVASGDARIGFEPAVPPAAVPALLAGFDVLCCPSRVVEGGPTVALEAHAVGTPVIGSDLPALSEIVHAPRDGALVPAGDRAALAALLADLAHTPARVDAWRAALQMPRTFHEVGEQYLAMYQAAEGPCA